MTTERSSHKINGTNDADTLQGGAGEDIILGHGGDDVLWGNTGNDRMSGGAGNDLFALSAGKDAVDGGAGSDFIDFYFARHGVDVRLSAGKVQFDVSKGPLAVTTFTGIEGVNGSVHRDTLTGDSGDNFLFSSNDDDRVSGNLGNDFLDGGHGSDRVSGNGGNDTIYFSGGIDKLDGGAGFDYLNFSNAGYFVDVDLRKHTVDGWADDEEGKTTFRNFEGVIGANGFDSLRGDQRDNVLNGASGDDVIIGADGNDILIGGVGSDSIVGGRGSDLFYYAEDDQGGPQAHDMLADFKPGVDQLMFSREAFKHIDGIGPLIEGWGGAYRLMDPTEVQIGSSRSAEDADVRMIYDTDDGKLFYDRDGDGPHYRFLIAQLEGIPHLTAADFHVW